MFGMFGMFGMFTHVQVWSSHSFQCAPKLLVTVDLSTFVNHKTAETQAIISNSSIH